MQGQFPFLKIDSEYTGANNKVKITCTNCEKSWYAVPRSVVKSKYGCKFCAIEKSKHDKAQKLFESRLNKNKFKLLEFNSPKKVKVQCLECGKIRITYINNSTLINIICNKHGEFQQLPYVHINMGCRCPKCKSSHGKEKIINYLNYHNIDYIYQKYIKYKDRHFVIDFTLNINGQLCFIEFNGKQHYEAIDHFGGQEQFIKQQKRDILLKEYCKENQIQLLEIRFDQEKEIDIIMNKFI